MPASHTTSAMASLTEFMQDSDKSRPQYWNEAEVKLHNQPDDIWVSLLGQVYDLTALVKKHSADPLIMPLLAYAGKDISHWFDPKTRDIKMHVDPVTQIRSAYLPHGQVLGTPPPYPSASWANDWGRPWWRDVARYSVGLLTNKSRRIRLVNMLTSTETTLEVPEEEVLWEILARHLAHNAHAASYVWKYDDRPLNMDLTLEENGIPNEADDFYMMNMDEDKYLPALFLHYADDLTEV